MALKLHMASDSGGSGHGATGLGMVKHVLDRDAVKLNWSTHFWAWNRKGWSFSNRQFPDVRFKEKLLRSGVNEDYLITRRREFAERPHGLRSLAFSSREAESQDLLIKQFGVDKEEDVNVAIGSPTFAKQQPRDVASVTEVTFNTTQAPDTWLQYSEFSDEWWVPCGWARDALVTTGFDKNRVKVVPYGVEFGHPTFNDSVPKLNDDKFTFMTVGRWCNLKGLDVLLKAFIKEFEPHKDDVRLFIKTTTNQQLALTNDAVRNTIRSIIAELRIPDPPEIGFSIDPLPTQQYWDVLGAADCYVHPSRAEAIGIAPVQALGLGLPVIATEWSAMKDYIDAEVAWPLDYEVVPVKQHDPRFYHYDEYIDKWANPDENHLRELMREIYTLHSDGDGEELRRRGEKGKKRVRDMFNWEKHIETRVERLKKLVEGC